MVSIYKFTNKDFDSLKQWIKSEEELIQFAGTIFNYPLTDKQLENYLKQTDLQPFKIKLNTTGEIIGHCELNFSNGNTRLSRILIGKSDLRGKGIGKVVINEMLNLIEKQKPNSIVDLNVFAWNKNAISCYNKLGFKENQSKNSTYNFKGNNWEVINMEIKLPITQK
jgi:RimJ/RimL family protein N-acetyltransferase